MTQSPVQITGLSHYFGEGKLRRQVLFDIETEISPAEIVILTGPSGSGKTTLLTLIGALRSAQQGSLQVLGNELRGADEQVLTKTRRQIGYIFQSHNLLEALTAQQNVMAAMFNTHGSSKSVLKQRAARVLEEVGLGDRLGAHPSELSGGQRQRVAIARALASEPRLLLADEPTASLDRETGREVVQLLRNLAVSQEVTVILVTHDNRILDIAERILSLEDGRLSSLMSVVASSTERSLEQLVRSLERGELSQRLAGLDHRQFHQLMDEVADETRRLLALTNLLQGPAFDSVAAQIDKAFRAHIAEHLDAEEVVLYFFDPEDKTMHKHGSAGPGEAMGRRFSADRGIVGQVAASGQSIIIQEAWLHRHFDAAIDGEYSRSIVAVPVSDSKAQVFATLEARSSHEGKVFSQADQLELEELAGSLGVLLESWWRMGCDCRRGSVALQHECCP
jgi:putative ABC transport system ATP-binding protein